MHLVGERVEAFLNAVFALTGYSGLQDGLLDEGAYDSARCKKSVYTYQEIQLLRFRVLRV